jgi:hypothetical protein
MAWLGYIGIMTLILGLLYLLAPNVIIKLDEWGRGVLISADQILKHRIWVGLIFAAAGAAMIYLGFTIK